MVESPSFTSFEWDLLVIDTPKGEDLILGFDFITHFEPSIDWRKVLITFIPDPSNAFSNDFHSVNTFAALVGNSRTPSFTASVHIPSPNSHQSLIFSIDKFFKDIKYAGEDNSISSLHLLHGSVDLPPECYHDSPEELWD
ncbi:hypothetical protein O181_004588 [Austropuccinia psidii MF-1]|uniref:Uncharacterized protein n=1 Tax=Austropuccinia psidii MF-1 TaxID=1389203 RepID=A0A9Q3GEP4_9BASI|nr:hypothetical protein [Austropuccinia psidii MF-1]